MGPRMVVAAMVLAAGMAPALAQAEGAVAEILRRAGVAATPGAVLGTDPKARADALDALERGYRLPPELRDRENTLPPDREAVMDRLGLSRHPNASVTRMTDRMPTRAEIVDALAGR
ncbi:MAG: hypothetical protein NZ523_00700 [Elioraea sp.]|nr:hypothetical protein [Elioraea sp.]